MYPWQQPQWQQITSAINTQRVPHAWMFTGPEGVGKTALMRHTAKRLMCSQAKDESACGDCQSCRAFIEGLPADVIRLAPEEIGGRLSIDAVRGVVDSLTMHRHGGGHRVIMLEPADALTIQAANSLLKTLEEPPEHTVFLVVCHDPGKLPATIKSRCQAIRCPVPHVKDSVAWLTDTMQNKTFDECQKALEASAGLPLIAQSILQNENFLKQHQALEHTLLEVSLGKLDPVAAATKVPVKEVIAWLDAWQRWLSSLIRMSSTQKALSAAQKQVLDHVIKTQPSLYSKLLFKQLDAILEAKRTLRQPVNPSLVLEECLIAWRTLGTK